MRVATILLLSLLAPGVAAASEPPSYLLLRAPTKPVAARGHQPYYPGRGYGVETHAYNYGWFGAKPGRTWQRSTGYYRNYTQWSVR